MPLYLPRSKAQIRSILALHLNYATLFTCSPIFLTSQTVWTDLASTHEGFQHLERGRDAAFAVIQAICSVSADSH